jgi:hypothetical protein
MLILLLSAALFTPPIAWATVSGPDVPLNLRLIADADRRGTLRYDAKHYEVLDPALDGRADRAESTPVVSGFEFSFLGTIPSPGRINITLSLKLLVYRPQPVGVQEFSVRARFRAVDGQEVRIPETADGPAILATPRIVANAKGPAAVLLEVDVPIGGEELSLPRQRLIKSITLVGTEGLKNSIRAAVGHSFVTGVTEGKADITTLEAGTELAAVISTDGDEGVGLDITVGCDLVDEVVATKSVLIDGLSQDLQLPVTRSLTVETVASPTSGETLVLAGVVAGGANPAEILIFATPNLIEGTPVPQALVEARLALAAGGGEPEQPNGASDRTQTLKQLTVEASEPQTGIVEQRVNRNFVVGVQDGETVTLSMDSKTSLKFTPETLAPGELLLGIDLFALNFAPESPQFSLNTASGMKPVELPETRTLDLNTSVSLRDGESIVLGGGTLSEELPGISRQVELVYIGTADELGGGVVRFEGSLARATTQSSQFRIAPDEVEHECSGSFTLRSSVGPDGGVDHSSNEALECLQIEPPL